MHRLAASASRLAVSQHSSYIRVRHIPRAVFADELLASRQIVSEQGLEHLCRGCRVGRGDANEPAGRGIHRRFRHHVRLVLTQSLGPLQGIFHPFFFQLADDSRLFRLVVSEQRVALLRRDLKKRRLRNVNFPRIDERRQQAVE